VKPAAPARTEGRVEAGQGGQTVAALVRALVPGLPWSRARELCRSGRVRVDDAPALDPAARVREGAKLVVDPGAPAVVAEPHPIALVHVDADVVVVHKPAGLATVPEEDGDRDSLVHAAHAALRRREKRQLPPLRVVQRLDKDTTGLVVLARTRGAERALGQQFRAHTVHRRYLALAYGEVLARSFDTMLVQDRGDGLRGSWGSWGTRRPSGPAPPAARRAITHVRPLELLPVPQRELARGSDATLTLVECRLETGRQHQIRIHLAESGHPLVGERIYVRGYAGPLVRGFSPGEGRVLLHAAELGFVHPRTESELRLAADLPPDFAGLLERLRARRS
jgi:23S rRNA pseudouridine1911/1915/1917 synthase